MLNSIKTLIRYCKVTLNEFFSKTIYDGGKNKVIYLIDFLYQIEILLLKYKNCLEFQVFQVFCSKYQVFPCLEKEKDKFQYF